MKKGFIPLTFLSLKQYWFKMCIKQILKKGFVLTYETNVALKNQLKLPQKNNDQVL